MARVPKKTELELATQRVLEMQAAVKTMEANLAECKKECDDLANQMREAERNYADTQDLLTAQRAKLAREIDSAQIEAGKYYPAWTGSECVTKSC